MSTQKSIILCAPADFGLYESIKKGLENLGFKVIGFPVQDANYSYKNSFARLHNAFRKIVFKDRDFKNKLKYAHRYKELIPQLKDLQNIDFALFIRPDIYPIPFIKEVGKIVGKNVAYQWDSFDRFPAVHNYLDLFNRFYVFDRRDVKHHQNLILTTNFYIESLVVKTAEIENKAYLLASYDDNRMQQATTLKQFMLNAGVSTRFMLNTKKNTALRHLADAGMTGIKTAISYADNLALVQSSKFLVDLHNPSQRGLSFRIMESLLYGKKLITTNTEVRKYDFYNPNNIFIWNGKDDTGLYNFLEKSYSEVDTSIIKKYSLGNWINYVLDEHPHEKIVMPH